jgi:hypothetical protein
VNTTCRATTVAWAVGARLCQQHQWRERLAEQLPVKFALVETSHNPHLHAELVEVILTSGERLRIAPGIDAVTLRLVLSALREKR